MSTTAAAVSRNLRWAKIHRYIDILYIYIQIYIRTRGVMSTTAAAVSRNLRWAKTMKRARSGRESGVRRQVMSEDQRMSSSAVRTSSTVWSMLGVDLRKRRQPVKKAFSVSCETKSIHKLRIPTLYIDTDIDVDV